jgi:hypothetical protein
MGIGQIVGLALLGGVLLVTALAVARLQRLRRGGIDVALRCDLSEQGRGGGWGWPATGGMTSPGSASPACARGPTGCCPAAS